MTNYKRQFKTEAEKASELYGEPMTPLEASEYKLNIAEQKLKEITDRHQKFYNRTAAVAVITFPFVIFGLLGFAERWRETTGALLSLGLLIIGLFAIGALIFSISVLYRKLRGTR